ncbi:MAG: TerB family tellurite resistance protein, partial [Paludibacteraceae bacterium]|nr:TerB family tellurite resistance protein [Paludibacteraceae bacterium]
MNPHKICIILMSITILIMLLAINSTYQSEVITFCLLMLGGEFAYLLSCFFEKDDDNDDFLFCCIKLMVYTAKYCGCNGIDDITRVKIRKFIIKNEPQNLSTRLKELDNLAIHISDNEVSNFDIFLLCEMIKRKLNSNNNPSWIFSNRNLILDILFSVVYQSKNSPFILEYISKIIGDEYLFETKRKEYERKYSKKADTNNENNKNDKDGNNNKKNKNKDTKRQFVTLTLELLAEAMKVDRSKMVCELDVIKSFIMKYDKDNFQERLLEVKKHLSSEYTEVNVEGTCSRINKQFRQNYQKREETLKILVDLIYADDTCTNAEYNFLKKVAERLKVSKSAFDFMRMKYENRKNKQQNKRQENKQQSNRQNGNSQEDNN